MLPIVRLTSQKAQPIKHNDVKQTAEEICLDSRASGSHLTKAPGSPFQFSQVFPKSRTFFIFHRCSSPNNNWARVLFRVGNFCSRNPMNSLNFTWRLKILPPLRMIEKGEEKGGKFLWSLCMTNPSNQLSCRSLWQCRFIPHRKLIRALERRKNVGSNDVGVRCGFAWF